MPKPMTTLSKRAGHDLSPLLRHRLGLPEKGDLAGHPHLPAWLRNTEPESRWPVQVAVLIAIALQVLLPDRLALHPVVLLPSLELALLIGLTVANPVRLRRRARALRLASTALVVAMTLANAISAGLLVHELLAGRNTQQAGLLLASGGSIYLTNIIAFGLWYWEYDRGGPHERAEATNPYPDFLFPQMVTPEVAAPDWEAQFIDYLYVSFTNATAFSPTDTMPLSRWAKMLMLIQSGVSLVTVALVVARAVNIFH